MKAHQRILGILPSILKETIPLHELSAWLTRQRDEGYIKGTFEIFPDNKKYVTIRTWRKKKNPVGRPRKAVHQYSDGSTVEYDPKLVTGGAFPGGPEIVYTKIHE